MTADPRIDGLAVGGPDGRCVITRAGLIQPSPQEHHIALGSPPANDFSINANSLVVVFQLRMVMF